MRILFASALFVLVALIQVVFVDIVNIRGVKPDLLLIAAVFFCLRAGWQKGLLLGMIAGFVYDLLSSGRMGAFTVSFGVCGLILGLFTYKLYFENPLTQSIIVFLATILSAALYFLVSSLFYDIDLWNLFIAKTVSQAVYNMFVSATVFFALWRLERKRLFSF